ncbi:DCL family protein [Frigoribacterium salinisoli]
MVSHPISLASHDFANKTAAKCWVSTEILNAAPLMVPITNPDHIDVLTDLLMRKDDADEKIGTGIKYFYVDLTHKFKTYAAKDLRTFVVQRDEGPVDFGFIKAVDGNSAAAKVRDALRSEILDLRDDFKDSHFEDGKTAVSAVTGEVIARREDAEVRYSNPSWTQLTSDFATTRGGWDAIATHTGNGGIQIGRRLLDGADATAWRDYWLSNAVPIITKKP